jgi:hypothetical protein
MIEEQEKPAKKWYTKWLKRLMLATIVIVICVIVVVAMAPIFVGNGLKLSLSLSPTTLKPGQELSIVIDEQNTASVAVNVSSSTNWQVNGTNGYISSLDPCEDRYPFGVAIFQGYYSSANVSTATPLALYSSSSSVIFCPLMLFISSYGFQPLSDIAAMYYDTEQRSYSTAEMKAELNVTGYWTDATTLTNFTPGVYTVVARDEWGASEVLHFVVSE